MKMGLRTGANTLCDLIFIAFLLVFSMAACVPDKVTSPPPQEFPSPVETDLPLPPSAPSVTPPCTNSLIFLDDLTIPDYSIISPGEILDKQWLVQNSGSCNWDSHYRLRLISGEGLGAAEEQALYPARGGMQARIRIVFTAPFEPGDYYSEWQAFDPSGQPFGESFAIRIIVQ